MVPLSRHVIINLEVNIMKRIGLIIAGVSLAVLLLGAGVWADITITDTTGPDLTYSTSPNVTMNYDDNATGDKFLITSCNTKGTIEYGIISDFSGYYMRTVDVGSNASAIVEATIAGWTTSSAQ